MSEQFVKKQTLIVLALMAIHVIIAVPLAYHLNIWVDEASTLYATQSGFWAAFQTAAAEQKQAPLYFWIVSLLRYLNDSIFFARLLSVICSLAAIWLFSGLASRILKPAAALAMTAFFALHPFLFWASVEIRVYSLVILLTVVLFSAFFAAFVNDDKTGPDRRRLYPKLWFLAVVIVSLYTNYYLGFVVAGLGFALVVSGRWRDVGNYSLLMVVAGIAFLPMLVELRAEFIAKTGGFVEPRSLSDGLRAIWNHVLTFVLPSEIFPGEDQTVFSIIRVWIVRVAFLIIAAMAIIRRKQITQHTLILGVATAVVCAFLLAAYFLVGHSYIVIRHASILFVPVILFIASLISDAFGGMSISRSRSVGLVMGLLILVSFTYGTYAIYPNLTKRGDWARVGEFIRQNESPGQPIVVFLAFEALALRYNYVGVNQILPDERYFTYGPEAAADSPDSHRREIEFIISKIPADADRIWLAVSDKCSTTAACIPLQKYVNANYTIEIEKDFYLEKVYLLKRKE